MFFGRKKNRAYLVRKVHNGYFSQIARIAEVVEGMPDSEDKAKLASGLVGLAQDVRDGGLELYGSL